MTPPVGLYSIGMSGLDVSEVLAVAAAERVPYLHLRAGPRGCDLARADPVTVAAWARQARRTVPVTMVTSDVDICAFCDPGTPGYRQAASDLSALADAAVALGARSIRLLARAVPRGRQWETMSVPDLAASHSLLTVVELHDPGWFGPAAAGRLRTLLDTTPGLQLLLDTAQVHIAQRAGTIAAPRALGELARRAAVMHISDTGAGLDGTGHRAAARAAIRALATGSRIELAFEWTGTNRSPGMCLARYRDALAWWRRAWEATA